jgi:hypothetical protein
MADQPDIAHPHPGQVAREVNEVIAEFGRAFTPEGMERLARGAEVNANSYDGGPVFARAVAAEFRRRAADMRRRARTPTLPLAFEAGSELPTGS